MEPVGATLLVDGPVEAVGRLLVQLATRNGINGVAVAKPEDRDYAFEPGAAQSSPRRLHGCCATPAPRRRRRRDRPGGRRHRTGHAGIGTRPRPCTSSVPPYIDPTGPFDTQRGIRFEVLAVHPDTIELTRLLQALGRGELSSDVEHTYPLTQAAAHRRQQQGGLRGKLVLLP